METPQVAVPTGIVRRVLVVDDSKLQRRLISKLILNWGFEVEEASSGIDAMEICRKRRPDIIVSDWMMPEMDGLEFCRAFRELPTSTYGYFILLTSKGERGEITEGFNAGADDFVTKPVDPNVLRARISAGERILDMQSELSEKNRLIGETLSKLRKAYDSIDRDLMQAKKIQQSLVPEMHRSFGSSDVSLLLKPCGHVGGDLVGMFSPSEDQVAFYNIDVSGHGITSAMITARIGGHLSSKYFDQNVGIISREPDYPVLRPPAQVVETLNERLTADEGVDEYFTIAYATADLRTGQVRMVQAGHPHPLVIRANGEMEFLGQGGVPVGIISDAKFEEFETVLEPGDRLLLYSDGMTESIQSDGSMLDQAGLIELISTCQTRQAGLDLLDEIFWKLIERMDSQSVMDDDVSALLFEYNGP